MKKLMFNDKFGLTDAVLEGRKTNTRRIVCNKTYGDLTIDEKNLCLDEHRYGVNSHSIKSNFPKFKVGDIVAVAQSYKSIIGFKPTHNLFKEKGYTNKMYVKADLMPHRIQITGVRIERLQEISDDDCLKEGIYKGKCGSAETHFMSAYYFKGELQPYCTPRDAYAALIDKLSGKGFWESNPFVFVYDFKLIK